MWLLPNRFNTVGSSPASSSPRSAQTAAGSRLYIRLFSAASCDTSTANSTSASLHFFWHSDSSNGHFGFFQYLHFNWFQQLCSFQRFHFIRHFNSLHFLRIEWHPSFFQHPNVDLTLQPLSVIQLPQTLSFLLQLFSPYTSTVTTHYTANTSSGHSTISCPSASTDTSASFAHLPLFELHTFQRALQFLQILLRPSTPFSI